jgi:hypothetical protein
LLLLKLAPDAVRRQIVQFPAACTPPDTGRPELHLLEHRRKMEFAFQR